MSFRDTILNTVEEKKKTYEEIALDIHAHPEVSNYEFFACKRLSEQLAAEGFDMKVDVAGHRTGFTACYKAQKPGPVMVFLAEYDALGGLGHGCGHNLFGATSALAATALKQVINEVGGEVRVYGTPGEEGGENGSAKGSFVREGFLKDVDAALCVHPGSGRDSLTPKSLVCAPIDIEFWGKPAHASAAPEQGINALDALILTYNGLNALRQHLPKDVQFHGIITNGGQRPQYRPRLCQSQVLPAFRHRAHHECPVAQGGEHRGRCGADDRRKGAYAAYQNRVENTVPTPSFDKVYQRVMATLGVTVFEPDAHD